MIPAPPGENAIDHFLTHTYLNSDGTRTTQTWKIQGNSGEQMWRKFVRKHANIFLVLCGHFTGESVLTLAIPIIGDSAPEPTETFSVNLSQASPGLTIFY